MFHQQPHYSKKKTNCLLKKTRKRSLCHLRKTILHAVFLLMARLQNVLLLKDYLCKPNKWDLPASPFCFIFPGASQSFAAAWLSHDNDSSPPLTPLPPSSPLSPPRHCFILLFSPSLLSPTLTFFKTISVSWSASDLFFIWSIDERVCVQDFDSALAAFYLLS